ncbi:hypothetical protein ACW9HR_22065 [Nocardia gipuzkoensis]
MSDPSTFPPTGVDRFAQYQLVPTSHQQAPISHDYSAAAARDELHAKHLRGLQNLAAEAHREQTSPDLQREQHAHPASTPVSAALDTALRAASRDATADGVPAEGIERAIALGRTGVYWHQQPADPTLGRFEKITSALSAAQSENLALRAQVERLPGFVIEAWRRTVAQALPTEPPTNSTELQSSRAKSIDAAHAVENGSPAAPSAIGSAITDAMLDRGAAAAWTNEASPAQRDTGSGIGSQGAEL